MAGSLDAVRFEAVAHSWLGDEVPRLRGLGFELAADMGEVDPEVVGLVAVMRTPHLLEELAAGDELAGVANEHFDEMPFGWREPDLAAGADDLLRSQIDGEV